MNPGFAKVPGQACPVYDGAAGLCHNFAESSYTDNVGQIRINIQDRTGKTGGSINTAEDSVDDENRPKS